MTNKPILARARTIDQISQMLCDWKIEPFVSNDRSVTPSLEFATQLVSLIETNSWSVQWEEWGGKIPKSSEDKRKAANDDGAAYLATLESIEPDIHPIDASAFYASAAISLKRIADLIEAHEKRVTEFYAARDNVIF